MAAPSRSALLYFTFLAGVPFVLSSWSSTEVPSPDPGADTSPVDAAELIRDAPLYPVLRNEHKLPDILNTDIEQELDIEEPADDDFDPDLTFEAGIDSIDIIEPEAVIDDSTPEAIETEDATNVQSNEDSRAKRSVGQQWDKSHKGSGTGVAGASGGGGAAGASRRVKTGDTILNIRGAVRDAIGDAGAAPAPSHRASSRLDTFVIRPAQAAAHPAPRALAAHASTNSAHSRPQGVKSEQELLVEAHSVARIPCELSNTSDVLWYKDGEALVLPPSPPNSAPSAGAEGLWQDHGALVVGRATRGDAAAWRCTRADGKGNTVSGKPTRLLIYEPVRSVYLAVDGRRLDAGNTWVPVRDKTELEVRCVAEGGVPPPELAWRLLALEPALDHRPYLRIHNTNYSIEGVSVSHAVVTAARELHNATLACEARQRTPGAAAAPGEGAPHLATTGGEPHLTTAKLEIHVTYPPSFVISRWPGFGVSLWAGGAAALRCDVDANPPARAFWLRDDADPTSSPPPLEAGDEAARGSATLRWEALRGSHAGWYRCRATWLDTEYSSIGYYLNVIPAPEENTETATEPEPEPDEPDHQKVEVPLGGNVQLHCPKGSVGCWWRRVVGNSSESWAPAGSHHAHGVLGIKDALYQEGGEYRCVGARAPDLARLRELKRVTLKVTGGATATALGAVAWRGGWRLECGACGRGVRVLWVRGARVLAPATLAPALAQHCWRAVLHLVEPDEVWCVAVSPAGGAVAVFPPRTPPAPPAPPASPAPARHTVRAQHNAAHAHVHTLARIVTPLIILMCRLLSLTAAP